jgi:hypothetical protein
LEIGRSFYLRAMHDTQSLSKVTPRTPNSGLLRTRVWYCETSHWSSHSQESPRLIFGTAKTSFFVAVDYSVGFGSYAGVTTLLLYVVDCQFQRARATSADTQESEQIRLQDTLKSAWKVVPFQGKQDILLAYCRPAKVQVPGRPNRGTDAQVVSRRGPYPFAFFTSSISGGTISNRFPTTATSAISKMGASESLFTATMLFAPFMPTMC